MFNNDYFEYSDFNYIEGLILDLYNEVASLRGIRTIYPSATLFPSSSTFPSKVFKPKTWTIYDIPYIDEVDRIERNIKRIGELTTIPTTYVYKEWLPTPTSVVYKSFSRNDYNRWLINIEELTKALHQLEIRFSGEGYSGEGVWL